MAKLSIYLPDEVLALLGKPDSVSGRIAEIIERYVEIARTNIPDFTRDEWCAIFDHLNGFGGAGAPNLTLLWAGIADTQGLGRKWGFDQEALAKKLRGRPYAQLVAIAELHAAFWALPGADAELTAPGSALDHELDVLGIPPRASAPVAT